MQRKYFGCTYIYPKPAGGTIVIGVAKVLGELYAVCSINEDGSRRRIKSPQLPVVSRPESAQSRLDKWARKKGLKEVV